MSENNSFPMHVGIVVTSAAQLASVYALLGGVVSLTIAPSGNSASAASIPPNSVPTSDKTSNVGSTEPEEQASDPNVVDAHGWPWSPDLHASTRTQTKEGLWRMKVGVTRPDPKPGFPIADAGSPSTASTGATASTPSAVAATPAAGPVEEDDEFAAFRAASEKVDAATEASPAPARQWTDADLGALCNQAAVKLGDPTPIKELIANFVPEGTVAHSRNIPEGVRGEFVAAVEAKAGIKFAG